MEQYVRMDLGRRARAAVTGSAAVAVLVWIWWIADPGAPRSAWLPGAATVVLLTNVALTVLRPSTKRVLVAMAQRYVVNPPVRLMFRIGFVPFGFALVETIGRRSGQPRTTPVGNGVDGDVFWIVAEHGYSANYVRNLIAQPRVRLKLRQGWRFVWRSGVATVLPNDDPLRRQRELSRLRPLRILNAITVRTLGTDLVVVRIDLDPEPCARQR